MSARLIVKASHRHEVLRKKRGAKLGKGASQPRKIDLWKFAIDRRRSVHHTEKVNESSEKRGAEKTAQQRKKNHHQRSPRAQRAIHNLPLVWSAFDGHAVPAFISATPRAASKADRAEGMGAVWEKTLKKGCFFLCLSTLDGHKKEHSER